MTWTQTIFLPTPRFQILNINLNYCRSGDPAVCIRSVVCLIVRHITNKMHKLHDPNVTIYITINLQRKAKINSNVNYPPFSQKKT